ncbi:VOC family protein [Streptomyces sp. HF10]|uniref:VOC family protein n=1 Tax=Streptomyces sp. HF10 TaxID=2692233 RepID=UPI0013175EEC|nr:VOC family protein [Streptomyces sp. HF10]QHC29795.1 VOC family protein [Streptomyces sp. HF10]
MALAELGAVVLDCPDPDALAGFYAAVLGGTVEREQDGRWVDLKVPGGRTLAFQRAEGHTPPRWPRAGSDGQQFHLDLTVPDLDAAQEGVLKLGATLLDAGEPGRTWRVYADPAGHPFCLCAC